MTVHREFVPLGENSFWALAVEYMLGAEPADPASTRSAKPRVDYKEVLSSDDFALFAKLRDWRKAKAGDEGIPVYAVLTNEQLAAVATKRPKSTAQLREVEGLGEAKAVKYSHDILKIVFEAAADTTVLPSSDTGAPVAPDAPPTEPPSRDAE